MRRETSRVSFLMCPFCVRASLSDEATAGHQLSDRGLRDGQGANCVAGGDGSSAAATQSKQSSARKTRGLRQSQLLSCGGATILRRTHEQNHSSWWCRARESARAGARGPPAYSSNEAYDSSGLESFDEGGPQELCEHMRLRSGIALPCGRQSPKGVAPCVSRTTA
jgi:hypothetical protein